MGLQPYPSEKLHQSALAAKRVLLNEAERRCRFSIEVEGLLDNFSPSEVQTILHHFADNVVQELR